LNIRLAAARIHIPRRLKLRGLRQLFALTAEAFRCPVPDIGSSSIPGILESYARFTAGMAESLVITGESEAEVKERLREAGFSFGTVVRRELRVRSRSEVIRAGRILYRILGIDFSGATDGGIVIRKCLFAGFYSPGTCSLISALDEGLLAGLAGGGSLVFSGRITEGCPACTARFRFPEGL